MAGVVTDVKTIVALLRPLVERRVRCVREQEFRRWFSDLSDPPHAQNCVCGGSGTVLDRRFAALREASPIGLYPDGAVRFSIRRDLGSIVRAAAACGYDVLLAERPTVWEGSPRAWVADLRSPERQQIAPGDSPEEAAARALRAVVGGEA